MLRQKALEIACLLPTDDKDNRNSPLKRKVTTTMMMMMMMRKMMIMALMIQMIAIVLYAKTLGVLRNTESSPLPPSSSVVAGRIIVILRIIAVLIAMLRAEAMCYGDEYFLFCLILF